ncbi:MAG: TlpA family protein disulfide reductase [Phycisphaerales bacterium]|nr:MAG: TlpA family protein disulfide reductase [Phycisphaerales bacterium]
MTRFSFLHVCIVAPLFIAPPAGAQDAVSGTVVDANGNPVRATVADFWTSAKLEPAPLGYMHPLGGGVTGASGQFTITAHFYGDSGVLLAVDAARDRGGLVVVDPANLSAPVTIKLGPLVEVHGRFFCEELQHPPPWTNVYIKHKASGHRLLQCDSHEATFAFKLPPGEYSFDGYGSDVHGVKKTLTLVADKPVVDMGTIDLRATGIAMHKGKAPPPWHVTDARGVPKTVQVSDFKGKWVLLEFWGVYCGPCIARSLPGLMDLYEAHRADRDKFEILAFHDTTVQDFKELDQKLVPIKKSHWNGRDLPFPILLDSTGETLKAFGVTGFPTTVLIDPDGKLVGQAGEEDLEAKLPPLPMAERLARAIDRQVRTYVDDSPLNEAIQRLAEAARVPIRLDAEALTKAGIQPNDTVPLTLSGRLSLRSWLNVVLDAHKLTFNMASDGVVIAPRPAGQGSPPQDSPAQRASIERIEARLREATTFDFKDKPLAAVATYFENETGENFILEPAARKAGRLDPNRKVFGSADNKPLGAALKELLGLAGLTYVIRDELVVLTPVPTAAGG